MGNYAIKGESYTKPESDTKYASKTDIETTIQQLKNLASAENVYTKTDTDNTFVKKLEAANLYQAKGEYASIEFVNSKFDTLKENVNTNSVNLGDFFILNKNTEVCVGKKNETQMFCFDGKIVNLK